jgi:hypothetical protein
VAHVFDASRADHHANNRTDGVWASPGAARTDPMPYFTVREAEELWGSLRPPWRHRLPEPTDGYLARPSRPVAARNNSEKSVVTKEGERGRGTVTFERVERSDDQAEQLENSGLR